MKPEKMDYVYILGLKILLSRGESAVRFNLLQETVEMKSAPIALSPQGPTDSQQVHLYVKKSVSESHTPR